jgi:Tol biopolymer transport system component
MTATLAPPHFSSSEYYLLYSRDELALSSAGLELHSLWALDTQGQLSGPLLVGIDPAPRISSDCSRMIYYADSVLAPSTWRPTLADLRSLATQMIDSIRGYVTVSWSPDGKNIVTDVDYEISVQDLETGVARTLTNCHSVPEGPMDCYSPSWSPDGARIAYYGAIAAPGDDPRNGLYLIDPMCPDEECVPEGPFPLGEVFSWSPDGRAIASAELLSLEIFDVGLRQVTDTIPVDSSGKLPRIGSIVWVPDASALVFSLDHGIGSVSLRSREQVLVALPDTLQSGDPLAKEPVAWLRGECLNRLGGLPD